MSTTTTTPRPDHTLPGCSRPLHDGDVHVCRVPGGEVVDALGHGTVTVAVERSTAEGRRVVVTLPGGSGDVDLDATGALELAALLAAAATP